MDNRKKPWLDTELKQMLLIMKKGHFSKLCNNANETNLEVYEAISKQLAQHKMNKTARQVRDKFNCLWLDYVKLEKSKDYSKAGRQTLEYFDLLKEIFAQNKESKPMNDLQDPLSEDQAVEINDESDDEMTDDVMSESESSEDEKNTAEGKEQKNKESMDTQNEEAALSANNPLFNDKQCQLYKKVIANFTKDWKASQRSLLENLKRQDGKDLRTITKQYKNQEALLRKDRQELEKILAQDRQEMKNILDNVLQTIARNSVHNGTDNNLKVKEENDEGEDLKVTLP